MFSSSGSGGAVGLGVASAVRNGEAMLCYRYMYVLCAAGGDEGSHSNCSGLNFKWARWTLLGQATTCGPAAPGLSGHPPGSMTRAGCPCEPGRGQYKSGHPDCLVRCRLRGSPRAMASRIDRKSCFGVDPENAIHARGNLHFLGT